MWRIAVSVANEVFSTHYFEDNGGHECVHVGVVGEILALITGTVWEVSIYG